jgi:gamma-glutamylcyclotransferase (GGCT)/AIG2-like uncharacterized protein YtfP
MNSDIHSVFVYGTLKRGQVRAGLWPFPPLSVRPGRIQGELYDLGPYPALALGVDWVGGEVWSFRPEQMEHTLEVLDEIEELHDQPDDLYRRIVTDCHLEGAVLRAFVYVYAMPLENARRVFPGGDGICIWP